MKNFVLPALMLLMAAGPVSAASPKSSPAAVVRAAYTCVFSKTCSAAKARAYLTPSFAKKFAEVDALEAQCGCEVIDASPWVDAQAGPDAFSVGAATLKGDRANVPVHFSGGMAGAYTLTIEVQRTAAGWAISDIRQRNGQSTPALMALNIAQTKRDISRVFASPDDVLSAVERWQSRATMNGSLTRSFQDAIPYLTPAFAKKAKVEMGTMNPFTLSPTPATNWESKKATIDGNRATALVHLQFRGPRTSNLLYHFQRIGSRWAISDITPIAGR